RRAARPGEVVPLYFGEHGERPGDRFLTHAAVADADLAGLGVEREAYGAALAAAGVNRSSFHGRRSHIVTSYCACLARAGPAARPLSFADTGETGSRCGAFVLVLPIVFPECCGCGLVTCAWRRTTYSSRCWRPALG